MCPGSRAVLGVRGALGAAGPRELPPRNRLAAGKGARGARGGSPGEPREQGPGEEGAAGLREGSECPGPPWCTLSLTG